MNLKKSTPYMVRKNGEILDVSPIHPYIKYIITDDNIISICKLINNNIRDLKWFYDNTEFTNTVKDIELFLISILNSEELKSKINAENIYNNFDIDFKRQPYLTNLNDIIDLFNLLNNECNQEFLKLRTSNMRFGGDSGDVYFRVGSINYNWFNTIWRLVYDNKNFITSVTICIDTQAKGGAVKFYQHNGVIINQLNIDDFINLSGNPIIENKNYNGSLNQIFENVHPHHINRIVEELWESYQDKNFVAKELNIEEALKELNNLND